MTPEIKEEVDKTLLRQSGRRLEDEMTLLAGTIKSVVDTHFGEPENGGILDLNESKDAVASFVAQSYRKVEERYKIIARL
ncbi:MAG: hypothetical protein US62_C0015G0002 [Candidatus Woesebacteria bacterium GW2011_GWA1_37_8]|uniref:Uncharacterized protein n=2 Tax=Candidatus Woeseibacteriota TaxID=1752722 RepID=A0A0G0NP30_9BACT|nr:MAG: hypothetical protein US62_C0015G0002 [Candidatus Woesebacteria bacterium GW2011_GWA1_37_8]KKQ87624.1 MAG: hypothetical protein UT10_C0003G0028 [Candidatus Woesebacteria bacterium GW2011_GWB1_38_8b]